MKKESFGAYIAHLREAKSMSQRRLAEVAGITNSTVSRIEADLVKPDPSTLEKIATALGEDQTMLFTKCGYSEIPEEFIVIARKSGELSEQQRQDLFDIFNKTIDSFLAQDIEES